MNSTRFSRIAISLTGLLCGCPPALAADPYVAPLIQLTDQGVAEFASAEPDPYAGGGILDEVRLGGQENWAGNDEGTEDGGFVTGQLIFDPLWGSFGSRWFDAFLRPRPHLGASVSVADGTNQVIGGLTWTFPVLSPLFIEATFGGALNDGDLDTPGDEDGLALGCHLLFHESLGLGVELGDRWRIIGSVDHSSHAGLCADQNSGLTRVGGSLGYRF